MGSVDNAFDDSQVALLAQACLLWALCCLQAYIIHRRRSTGILKLTFRRFLPVLGSVLLIQAIDPYGLRGVYNREEILIFRAAGAILIFPLVGIYVYVLLSSVYTHRLARETDRRSTVARVFKVSTVFFTLAEIFTVTVKCLRPADSGWSALRALYLVFSMWTVVGTMCVYTVQLRTFLQTHTRRASATGSSELSQSASSMESALSRLWRVMWAAVVVCLVGTALELNLAYQTYFNDRHDPVPLREDDAESSSFALRYAAPLITQSLVAWMALYLAWQPLKAACSDVPDDSHSHASSQKAQGMSPRGSKKFSYGADGAPVRQGSKRTLSSHGSSGSIDESSTVRVELAGAGSRDNLIPDGVPGNNNTTEDSPRKSEDVV